MEAVIAAIYLDAGWEAARARVLALWGERIGAVGEDARDAKTALQEWAQAQGQTPPVYAAVGRSGPDHAPSFTIEVRLASGARAEATAGTKRQAEQMAAQALLSRLG
jgi:ribonuclease-3